MFAPSKCRTVLVENVTFQSPPNTHISLRNLCRDVTIRGIKINTTPENSTPIELSFVTDR